MNSNMKAEETTEMQNTEDSFPRNDNWTRANENGGRSSYNVRKNNNGFRGHRGSARNNYGRRYSYNSNRESGAEKPFRDEEQRNALHDFCPNGTNKNFIKDNQYTNSEHGPINKSYRNDFHHQTYTENKAFQYSRKNYNDKRHRSVDKHTYYRPNFNDKNASESIRGNEIHENPQIPPSTDRTHQDFRENYNAESRVVSEERNNLGSRSQAVYDVNYNRTESVFDETARTKGENSEIKYECENWDEHVLPVLKQNEEFGIHLIKSEHESDNNVNFVPQQNEESQFQQKGKQEWSKQRGKSNRFPKNRVSGEFEEWNDQEWSDLKKSNFLVKGTSQFKEMQQSTQENSQFHASSKDFSQNTYNSNSAFEHCSPDDTSHQFDDEQQDDEEYDPFHNDKTFRRETYRENNRYIRYPENSGGRNCKNYKDNRDNYRENCRNNRYHKNNRYNRRQNSHDGYYDKDNKYTWREDSKRKQLNSRKNSASRARFSEHSDTEGTDDPQRFRSRNSESFNENIGSNPVPLEKSTRDRDSSEHQQKLHSNSRSARTKNTKEKNGESTEDTKSTKNPTKLEKNSKKNENKKEPNKQGSRGKGNSLPEELSRRAKRKKKEELEIMRKNGSTNVVDSFIKEIKEDLFTVGEEYSLGHCVGADFWMSAGIAVQFRFTNKEFGGREELLGQKKNVGEVAILKRKNRYVFYLITKKCSTGKPNMASMTKAVKSLREECEKLNVTKLALPRIGCGLDRLDWDAVKELLYSEFHETNIEIVVYVQ